jgi:hypothetical protein
MGQLLAVALRQHRCGGEEHGTYQNGMCWNRYAAQAAPGPELLQEQHVCRLVVEFQPPNLQSGLH